MSAKRPVSPTLRPEDVAQALWDSTDMGNRDGEAQKRACRHFGHRVANFLKRFPPEMTVGDLQTALHHAGDAETEKTRGANVG